MSIVSAGCVVWLSRLQPLFAMVAACALAYQAWLVARRPRHQRSRRMLLTLGATVGVNIAIAGLWVALSYRYQ